MFFSLKILHNILSQPITLRQSDLGVISLSNSHHVTSPSSKRVSLSILDSNEIMLSIELSNMLTNSDSSSIISLETKNNIVHFQLVKFVHGVLHEVQFDSIIDGNLGVDILQSSSVVGDVITGLVGPEEFLLDFAEFVLGFLGLDFDEGESLLDVVEDSVVSVHFGNFDDVHESTRILVVSPDFVVDFDQSFFLVENLLDVSSIEGDFEFLFENDLERDGLSEFVGSLCGSDGVDSGEFVHHPGLGCCYSLKMFFRSSCHK